MKQTLKTNQALVKVILISFELLYGLNGLKNKIDKLANLDNMQKLKVSLVLKSYLNYSLHNQNKQIQNNKNLNDY